jgi:hypothetical protein
MCEQCCAKADEYGQDAFIPGFYLCRATQDGHMMKAGDWGIVECNDPAFIFHTTPVKDPWAGFTDEQIAASSDEELAKFNEFVDTSAKISEEMADNVVGEFALDLFGRLCAAMCKAGFDPETGARASSWLCHRLACFIEANPRVRRHEAVIY